MEVEISLPIFPLAIREVIFALASLMEEVPAPRVGVLFVIDVVVIGKLVEHGYLTIELHVYILVQGSGLLCLEGRRCTDLLAQNCKAMDGRLIEVNLGADRLICRA